MSDEDIAIREHNRRSREHEGKDTESRPYKSAREHNDEVREGGSDRVKEHNAEVSEPPIKKKSFTEKIKEKYSQVSKYIPHKDPKPKVASSGKKPKKSKKGARVGRSYKGARSSNLFGTREYIPQEVRVYSAPDPFEGESHIRGGMRYEPPEIHMSPPDMGFKKPKKWRP
jgi:hypothetical protein